MNEQPENPSRRARFGGFEVDLRSGELTRQGRLIRLPEKSFQVLTGLLERPGELVTRDELRERLWPPDTFVDFDNNMNAAVSRLREALNDSAQGPRFIETIPRRGYRYVGPPPQWDGDSEVDRQRDSTGWRLRASLIAATFFVLFLAVVVVLIRRAPSGGRGEQPSDRRMLAVLPFENLGGEPEREYLADGLTEELLTELGRVSPEQLGVIARTSVRQYKGSEKTIEEIGADLEVDFIVEGSIRSEGERLRVSAQLIRVSDQTHLWAEHYDRPTTSVLDVQRDIARQVAFSILPRLELPTAEQGKMEDEASAEAFDSYLAGRFELAKDDPGSIRRAVKHFDNAIVLEPKEPRYWIGLADALNIDWFAAETPEQAAEIRTRARAAAERALELDPSRTEARVALAFSRLYHDWDPWGAIEALVVPIEGSVNSTQAYQLAAAAFAALARHDDALALSAEGLLLDPAAPDVQMARGWYLLFAGRYDEAEKQCQKVLETEPRRREAIECKYQALLGLGRGEEAVRLLGSELIANGVPQERFNPVDPTDPEQAVPEIEQIRLEQIFAERESDPQAPFDAAASFASRGEVDRAFSGLEMALEARDARLLYLAVDPRWETLHADPRFGALLEKIGLPAPE